MGENNLSKNNVSIIYLNFSIFQAELKVSMLPAKNNILLDLADKWKAIFLTIFPDSKTVQEYNMSQTKASYVVNESLTFSTINGDIMKTDFYSLSTYGSNDKELEKMNLVRLFDII